MPDKVSKKKPEIPQPRPDIILPGDYSTADRADHAVPHSPSPHNGTDQQSQRPDQEVL